MAWYPIRVVWVVHTITPSGGEEFETFRVKLDADSYAERKRSENLHVLVHRTPLR